MVSAMGLPALASWVTRSALAAGAGAGAAGLGAAVSAAGRPGAGLAALGAACGCTGSPRLCGAGSKGALLAGGIVAGAGGAVTVAGLGADFIRRLTTRKPVATAR